MGVSKDVLSGKFFLIPMYGKIGDIFFGSIFSNCPSDILFFSEGDLCCRGGVPFIL